MKLFIFMTTILMFVCATSALAAYGTGVVTLGSGSNALDVRTSNDVNLDYATTTGTGETFSVSTYHGKGTRTYVSTSNDSVIFYQNKTAVAAPTAPTGTGTMDNSSWIAM
jgi:hypothetical protein